MICQIASYYELSIYRTQPLLKYNKERLQKKPKLLT